MKEQLKSHFCEKDEKGPNFGDNILECKVSDKNTLVDSL